MTIVPSYGRDYTSGKAARADWEAGKDFTIMDMSSRDDGRQINLADAQRGGISTVTIRYKRHTQLVVVKIKPAAPRVVCDPEPRHPASHEQ